MYTTIDHNNYEVHLGNLLSALGSESTAQDAKALVNECQAKGLSIYPNDDNGIDIYEGDSPIDENVWQELLDDLYKYYAVSGNDKLDLTR